MIVDYFFARKRLAPMMPWLVAGLGAAAIARRVYLELNKYDFKDKVVLITGGSRGLGLELGRVLAAKGARLAICSRNIDQLDLAKQELENLGAEVLALSVDITVARKVQSMVQDVIRHFGTLDVLINNAVIIQVGPQEVMTVKDYQAALNTNFWAAYYTTEAALMHFRKQGHGRIANISSIGGKIAVPHLLPYSVSKFALTAYSEGMHAELKKENIQVTTVIPNLMRTGSARNVTVKGDHEAEYQWFRSASSLPLLSQSSKKAANEIVQAIEYGRSEVILSTTGRLAASLQGLAPETVTMIAGLSNDLMPDSSGEGGKAKYGYEVEPEIKGKNDKYEETAIENNEL